MKKIILSAVAMLAFGFAGAQGLHFGVKAGANLSNLRTDYGSYGDLYDLNDYESKIGFHVGAFVEWKFNDKFALQPEVVFSQQGGKVTDYSYNADDVRFSYETKRNLSYINIPVMFKFYPIKSLWIEAGPQLGILVSAKDKYDTDIIDDSVDETTTTISYTDETDIKDDLKTIDFGFNIGAGYEFTENFFVNLRYNLGLTNIYDFNDIFNADVEDSSFLNNVELKNSVLSLSVGYKF